MSYGPEEGSDHICPDCGAKWWDADGGCSCTKCAVCGKVGDEDFAQDGMCSDCHDETDEESPRCCESCGVPWVEHMGITGICAQLQDAKKTSEARRCANMILSEECDTMHERIRVLEFQNAELRAKNATNAL